MTKAKSTVSLQYLNECVYLDGSSIFWKVRPEHHFTSGKYPRARESKRWNARYSGKPAFNTLNRYGYLYGKFAGINLYAHRVIWALHYNEWPYDFIDHINGDRTDNSIKNLRVVDITLNNRSAAKRVDNKSGYACIRTTASGKYEVNVRFGGKQNYLGVFSSIDDAILARDKCHLQNNYTKRHGK